MSTTVPMTHTPFDVEETAMDQSAHRVRIAIREVREYAYRALVVAGASPGEAMSAAEQVVHAELHEGDGLAGLARTLTRGPWPTQPLTMVRVATGVLDVRCGDVADELQLSTVLTDLAAGEAGRVCVSTDSSMDVNGLWDSALVAAAVSTAADVVVIGYGDLGRAEVRLATAAGDLVVGRMPEVHGSPRAARVEVRVGPSSRPRDLAVLSRSTVAERATRRRQAAQRGVSVDSSTWAVVADHAKRFLVPEVDA
ncbi:hypothetical protein [Nocardioides iriomotensis]|uniref:Uncharacterized protein n=1 Tax=Nocardioides iriomotensis TaxID=715784 RepID=A0A4V1Z2L6_9ACTN|nr:hypothetical protein [Nocardioides iriomotensis]RYU14836.1 hypothetical protein ETU37_02290 [Nocardioides iriomotensis]